MFKNSKKKKKVDNKKVSLRITVFTQLNANIEISKNCVKI